MQKRGPKTRRTPSLVKNRRITERDLTILELLAKYRFLPSSLLLALIPGNENSTYERLRVLYHKKLVNRVFLSRQGEANYYLDRAEPLRLLVELKGIPKTELHWLWVRYNRETNYAKLARTGEFSISLSFLRHELMISRFHCALELACRHSGGKVKLTNWMQDQLRNYVEVPKMVSERSGDEWLWSESDDRHRLPHEPDAFFELSFPELNKAAHYFYEADRKTTDTTKWARKLRAHFHFVVKQKKVEAVYETPRIHAVLVETLDTSWATQLREAAQHPMVSGKPSDLFLFTASPLLLEPMQAHKKRKKLLPRFIVEPTRVFHRVWFSPANNEPESILDRVN